MPMKLRNGVSDVMRCPSCGQPIMWIRTQRGRLMPVNAQITRYWQTPGAKGRVITDDGRTLAVEFRGDGPPDGSAHVPHFGDCAAYAVAQRERARREAVARG